MATTRGHGVWAPIMGVGYDRPLVQWSAGLLPGANNASRTTSPSSRGYLGARQDEASGSVATPADLPVGRGGHRHADRRRRLLLGTCAADTVVSVQPAAVAPNLDVRATLLDAAGVERDVDAPSPGFGDGTTATGLGGEPDVPGGRRRVGAHRRWCRSRAPGPSSGYDDYASLGAYTVSAPGCDGAGRRPAYRAPGRRLGQRLPGPATLTLTWEPPADTGERTGHRLRRLTLRFAEIRDISAPTRAATPTRGWRPARRTALRAGRRTRPAPVPRSR